MSFATNSVVSSTRASARSTRNSYRRLPRQEGRGLSRLDDAAVAERGVQGRSPYFVDRMLGANMQAHEGDRRRSARFRTISCCRTWRRRRSIPTPKYDGKLLRFRRSLAESGHLRAEHPPRVGVGARWNAPPGRLLHRRSVHGARRHRGRCASIGQLLGGGPDHRTAARPDCERRCRRGGPRCQEQRAPAHRVVDAGELFMGPRPLPGIQDAGLRHHPAARRYRWLSTRAGRTAHLPLPRAARPPATARCRSPAPDRTTPVAAAPRP